MKVAELVEIALANADQQRVEVAGLEPAEIATEAVSGLAQLVAELVDNALSFSEPGEVVRVSGSFDENDYLLSISDSGVGVSEHFMEALNRALEDPKIHIGGPEPRLGIQLVARLAGKHGIQVRLVSGAPGTTARATVPARLVRRLEAAGGPGREKPVFADVNSSISSVEPAGAPKAMPSGPGRTIDLTRFEAGPPIELGDPAPEEPTTIDVEEFLESVFSPLMEGSVAVERPAAHAGLSNSSRPPSGPSLSGQRQGTRLRVRIPGENFSLLEDEPSTTAGEAAVDIRKALSSFTSGRQTAADEPVRGN